ncbi:MAG: hypothetical protein ABJB69_00225 [Spartobacteria bacterium]
MTDYFTVLEQQRKPWLDPQELKEKYHGLARRSQPDQNVNEAYRVLVDPKLRLQHLLTLEGAPPSASSTEIPEELADLFMAIAPTLHKIDMVDATHVDELINQVRDLNEETLADVRAIDANWNKRLSEIEKLYRRISYLSRWLELLEERRFQLSI